MAQIYNRQVLRGGLFLASDVEHKNPLSWYGGARILRQAFESPAEMDHFWLELGNRLKEELSVMIQTGQIPANPPLSGFTIMKKGNAHYLDDTATLANSFEPRLLKTGKVIRGYAGVALIPKSTPSSHSRLGSSITNLHLLDILCQQGLVVYQDEMEPKDLQRLLAWRAQFLKGEGVGAEGPKVVTLDTFLREMKVTKTNGRPLTSKALAHGHVSTDLRKYVDELLSKQREMGYHVVPTKIGRQAERGRKIAIFIPPRPLFVPKVLQKLNKIVKDALGEALQQVVRITAHSLGYEPWDERGIRRHKANIRAIGLWGQEGKH